jgi:hypothetical protein
MSEKITIQELDEDTLVINNIEIDGWIDDENCEFCKCQRCYSERYDVYFCPYCNCWLESRCDDPECHFCKDRPRFPSKLWQKTS